MGHRLSVIERTKAYQLRNKLVPDGIVGHRTLGVMESHEEDQVTQDAILRPKWTLSQRDKDRLEGVHQDMLAIVHYAARVSDVEFHIPITGGVRTIEMQRDLLQRGKTKTLNSRHLTGHAVDIYAVDDKGAASWDHKLIMKVHEAFESAAAYFDIPLRWGGDWDRDGVSERRENDYVHHELPAREYGKSMASQSPAAQAWLKMIGERLG